MIEGINRAESRRLDWIAITFLASFPILSIIGIALHTIYVGFSWHLIGFWIGMHIVTGLGITAGYHRCFSHRSHKAHPILQAIYLLLGAMVFQHSLRSWARNHRLHHMYSDTDKDPHNINEGFFWAHLGWIIYRSDWENDYSNIKDLDSNKLVQWQDRYYWPIAIGLSLLVPVLYGLLAGDFFGAIVYGGILRITFQEHCIFAINSFAHTFGRQKYSLKCEARDSTILALLGNGEGFHSFHHRFANDYRNGWRWYQWDPSKWLIKACSFIGLAKDLKTAPYRDILRAQIAVEHELLQRKLAAAPKEVNEVILARVEEMKRSLEQVAARFNEAKKHLQLCNLQTERERWKNELNKFREELNETRKKWQILKARIMHTKQMHLLNMQTALAITSIA